jgi:hypothetical protein
MLYIHLYDLYVNISYHIISYHHISSYHVCMYVCMDGWMDAWMHGCMDAWMHGCMDAWMHVCTYVRTHARTYVSWYYLHTTIIILYVMKTTTSLTQRHLAHVTVGHCPMWT